jgi:hypothetical protein
MYILFLLLIVVASIYVFRLLFILVTYKKMLEYYDGRNTVKKCLIPIYGFFYELANNIPR